MTDSERRPQGQPPAAPLLKAEQLGFCYPDGSHALQGIDLAISAGERVALVGQNGSGKTTLARLLCGLNAPSTGKLYYRNQPLTGAHLEAERLHIGLLFQDPDDQLFGSSLVEDVAFGLCNQGLAAAAARERALEMLGRVGLAQFARKPPHQLSFGQKKRAALAGLLVLQPELLILDEPTANIDPQQEEVFLALLRDFSGTLICISHDLIILYELCQRAIVLDQGRVHHDEPLSQLISRREALRGHGLDSSFRLSPRPVPASAKVPAAAAASAQKNEPTPQLALREYSYSYPDGTRALRGLDLSIQAGERVAIVGENGAGKSTLLACLLGLRRGVGSYHFAGRKLNRSGRKRLWRQLGVVFQDCADQLFCPSVAEEVAFGLEQAGVPRSERQARVAAALRRVQLEGYEKRVPLHLSGGERKRLALASVLVMEPCLVILDEPSAGLDPRSQTLLLEILQGLDSTLLVAGHDLYLVGELTQRTLIMHRGCLLEDLSTSVFLHDDRLAAINGLAYSFRQPASAAIAALQHEHEHRHRHRHLHEHEHCHGEQVHSHLHEHEHEHQHHFVHDHDPKANNHEHKARLLHDHDHPDHEREPHDHSH